LKNFQPRKDLPFGPLNRYEEGLIELRREKDVFFRTDIDSPILPEQRSTFHGLNYYPPDVRFKVLANLVRLDKPELFTIATSTGDPQTYLKYGRIEFRLEGSMMQLFVYKSTEDPFARSLFVPFRDATSGSETYGSGRYLDLEEQGSDDYEVDFNNAYNPYCAYNHDYTCPIPPRENILPIKILAGEKNYK